MKNISEKARLLKTTCHNESMQNQLPQQGDRFKLPSGNVVEVTGKKPKEDAISCDYVGCPAPTGGASFTAAFLMGSGVLV